MASIPNPMTTTSNSTSEDGAWPSAEGQPFSRPIDSPIWQTAHRWQDGVEVIDVLEGTRCIATVYHRPGEPASVFNQEASLHDMWLLRCYASSITVESTLRAMGRAAATLSSTLQPANR